MGKPRRFNLSDSNMNIDRRNSEESARNRQANAGIGSSFRTMAKSPPMGNSAANSDEGKLRLDVGGQIGGPISFTAETSAISSGNLDISKNSAGTQKNTRGLVYAAVESGTSDTIDTITPAIYDGQILFLTGAVSTHSYTITHEVTSTTPGRILCPGNTDYTLSGDEVVILIEDVTAGNRPAWRLMSGEEGGGAGGGVSYPLTPSVNVLGTVTTNQTISLSASNAHSTTMTLGANITITFSNYPASGNQIEWEVEVTQDATGGRVITWPSEVVEDPGIVTTANTTSVVTFRTNDGGTTVHVVSLLNAAPTTAAGGANTTLSNLTSPTALNQDLNLGGNNIAGVGILSSNATDTADSGFLRMGNSESITWESSPAGVDGLISYNASNRFVLNANIVPDISATHTLGISTLRWGTGFFSSVDISTNLINDGNTTLGTTGGTDTLSIYALMNTTLNMNSNKITNVTDPTSAQDAATKNYVDTVGGGANTTLSNLGTTNINSDLLPNQTTGGNLGSSTTGKNWYNVFLGRVQFTSKMSEVTTQGSIQLVNNGGDDDMIFNVPSATADRFVWDMNGTAQMTLTSTELQCNGVNVDMENNSITDVNQLQVTGATGDTVIGLLTNSGSTFQLSAANTSGILAIYADTATDISTQIANFGADSAGINLFNDVDINDKNLSNVSIMNFYNATGTKPSLFSLTNDLFLNVGTGNTFEFEVGASTPRVKIDNLGLDIIGEYSSKVAEIIGNSGNILEIKLNSSADYLLTDNGVTVYSFTNTTGQHRFAGSAGLVADTDYVDMNDITTAPSTPSAGFARLYIFDDGAGNQSFRIKFDNGTIKTITTDT